MVLSSPEARPASAGAMPDVAASVLAGNDRPIPNVAIRLGSIRPKKNDPSGVTPLSQMSPNADSSGPTTSRARAPTLFTRRELTCAPTAIMTVIGRKASPALSGLKCSTPCM